MYMKSKGLQPSVQDFAFGIQTVNRMACLSRHACEATAGIVDASEFREIDSPAIKSAQQGARSGNATLIMEEV